MKLFDTNMYDLNVNAVNFVDFEWSICRAHTHITTHKYHLPSLSTYTPFNEKKWMRCRCVLCIAIVAYHPNELIISFCLFGGLEHLTLTASKIIMLSYKNSTSDVHLVDILVSSCVRLCCLHIFKYCFGKRLFCGQTFHWLNKNLYTIKKIIANAIIFTANVANNIDVDFIFT